MAEGVLRSFVEFSGVELLNVSAQGHMIAFRAYGAAPVLRANPLLSDHVDSPLIEIALARLDWRAPVAPAPRLDGAAFDAAYRAAREAHFLPGRSWARHGECRRAPAAS